MIKVIIVKLYMWEAKMMKKTTKILSVIFAIVMIIGTVSVGLSAYAATGDTLGSYDFTIQNVYKDINWSNVKAYKAATHVHTVRSDADVEINKMIRQYYSLGYDALALTDHGTVNYGWTEDQSRLTIFEYQYFVHGPTDELSVDEYKTIVGGTKDSRGYGMMEIPLGIELNGSSTSKCHINSYYADAGHGDLEISTSWPRTAVEKSYNAGGFTHINHIGEWSDGKDTPTVYNEDWLTRFTSIYEDYCPNRGGRNAAAQTQWMQSHKFGAGCIGMELVNTSDNRTKYDRRYVYDEILKRLAPQGINVFGFCEDDAHEFSDCDRNAQYFLINGDKSVAVSEANASPNSTQIQAAQQLYRDSMFYGEFYTSSKSSKNSYELGDGFTAVGDYPSVSNISVDNATDQITVSCKDATKVRLVADGTIIATAKTNASGDTVVFDLNKYEDKINSYVRIYMTGNGGITYLQPFLLTKDQLHQATVQFILPTSDIAVVVKDSNGSIVNDSRKYENNTYVLAAGTYTYTASRKGYKTKTAEFVVTPQDVANNEQKKIEIELEEDADVTPTYFYVPETIYLKPEDGRSFGRYIDRDNTTTGALHRDASTTGNIFFSRENATDITLTYDLYEGVAVNSITINNNNTTSSSTSLATKITDGIMARKLDDDEHSLIKWTVTYKYRGAIDHAYAYTYVYNTPTSSSTALVGSGGYGVTHKNTPNWWHNTMHIAMSAFITGVHKIESVSGTGYKYAPYYGEALANLGRPDDNSPTVGGQGYRYSGDSSSGGSANDVFTNGDTGIYYADISRVNNFSQFPYFTFGVDINSSDEADTNQEGVGAYCEFDGERVLNITYPNDDTYTLTTKYNGTSSSSSGARSGDYMAQFSGQRVYFADTTTANKYSRALPADSTIYTISYYAKGYKASRTIEAKGNFKLDLQIVDKSSLRTAIATAQRMSLQEEWFSSAQEWETYISAIVDASRVLGDPTADEGAIGNAYNKIDKADDNLQLKTGTATVKHYWTYNNRSELIYSEDSYSYYFGDGVVANAVEMEGYQFSRFECYADGSLIGTGTTDVDSRIADKGSYEWRFFYSPKAYNVEYKANSGKVFTPDSGTTAYYDQNFTLAQNYPSREGYTFNGWYLDLSSETYSSGETFKWVYTEKGEFSALWNPIKYRVTYNTNGGSAVNVDDDAKVAEYDATYSIITDIPSKTGFTFGGWKLNDGAVYTGGGQFIWNIAANGEFVAQWTATPYTVTFDPVISGITVEPSTKTVYYGSSYGDLPAPEKTGYSVAWYTNSSYTTASLVDRNTAVSIASDHTLYAKWNLTTYNITYSLDGGTVRNGTNPNTYNIETPTFTLKNPEKTGYVFTGWTGSNGVEAETTVSVEQGSTGDKTFTAHWSLSGYNITYNGLEGASNDSRNPSTYNYSTATFSIYPPSKPGYAFIGWTGTGIASPTTTLTIPYGSTGDRTFTANWQKETYTITYDLKDGTATGSNPTSYDIDTPTFRLSNPTKDGYTFTGWNETTGSHSGGLQVDIEQGSTGNLNFEATWTEIGNFTVTYDLKGGTLIGANPTGYTRGDYYKLINPTKDGYNFVGWMKKIGDGEERGPFLPGEIGGNEGHDIAFTAKWSDAVTYSISCNLNGGKLQTGANAEAYTVETESFTLINPVKTGYVFTGWSGTGLTGLNQTVTVEKGSTGNRSYNANWTLKNYTITYDFNGGADSGLPKQYNYNSNITVQQPVRSGYNFTGWNVKYNNFDWMKGGFNTNTGAALATTTNQISEPIILRAGKTYSLSATKVTLLNLKVFKFNGEFIGTKCKSTEPTFTPSEDCIAYIEGFASALSTDELKGSVTLNVSGTHYDYAIPAGSTGNMTFIANWTLVDYSISYDLGGGALRDGDSNPESYNVNTETFTLNNPTKNGHTFEGWKNLADNTILNPVTIAKGSTGNRNYTAVWNQTVYNITYILNGGTANNPTTYTYDENHRVQILDPTKTGYTFEGWVGTDLTAPSKGIAIPAGATGNRQYTATWTPETYPINYTMNGGINSSSNPKSYTVESAAITLQAPEQTGAVFRGWSGTGISGVSMNVTIPTGSTGARTYEANWDINEYQITYDLVGGTLAAANPSSYTVETPEFTLNNPTKAGYDFGGWIGTNLPYMTEYVTIRQGSTGNRSYTACWIPKSYTITYDLGDGYLADGNNPDSYTTDTPSFTLVNPVKTGYVFEGWTGTGLSAPTETVTISMGSTGNRSYTAVWSEDGYSITYILNGGNASNPSRYTILTNTFTLNNPVRPGYEFKGWTGTGISGSGISKNVEIPKGSTGNRTYEANWELETYTLTYDLDGGQEVLKNPETYTYISAPITLFTPVRTGYIFIGWEGSYYSGTRESVVINTGSTGDKSFKAVWEEGIYTLTYNLNGGTLSTQNPSSYRYDTPTFTLNNPTKEGYTFAGWSGTEIGGTERTVTIYQYSTGNRNFVANWSESENIITYTLNGGTIANGTNPTSYITKSDDISIINPSRTGYRFTGWTVNQYGKSIVSGKDANGTTVTNVTSSTKLFDAVINTETGGNVDFTANWEIQTYTIRYFLNGGTVAAANPTSYTIENNITLNNPTKNGYRFGGWSGTGLGSNKYETVNIQKGSTGDRKYTANWIVNNFTITYDYDGGYVDRANPSTYSILSTSISLNNPVKTGYKFIGWTGTGLSGTQLSVTIPSGSSGDRQYKANYSAVTYSISYLNIEDAEFTGTNSYTIESNSFTIPRPTKAGYTFTGWTGTDLTAQTLDITIAKGSTGNRTYKANWELVNYTISYNLDGGSEVAANPTSYNIESPNIKLVSPTKTGYAFIGWSEGTSTTKVTDVTIPTGTTGNKSYKANWSSEVYTITYSGWLGNVSNPATYTAADRITLNNPVRTGYTFLGWTGTGLSSITKNVVIPEGSSGNRSYAALWRITEYSITVTLGGGTSDSIPQSYTIDSAEIKLPIPKKSGYDFVGWSGTGISGTSRNVTIPTGSTGNRTYEAVWNERGNNTHRIYYVGYYNEPLKLQEVDGKYVNYLDYPNGSAIEPVTPPTVVGYKFVGWDVDLSLDYYKNYKEDLEVHAKYVVDDKIYTVIVDGVAQTALQYEAITLDGAAEKNGKAFQYWIDPDTNEIVSYYRNYKFNVYEHDGSATNTYRLISVYDNIDNNKAATRVTRIEGYSEIYDWFSVYVERSVRTDYDLIQHGLIFTSNASIGASDSNFVIGKPRVFNAVAAATTNAKNGVWTLTIKNPKQYNGTIYIRSYVKVTDKSGNTDIKYSTIKTYANTDDVTP